MTARGEIFHGTREAARVAGGGRYIDGGSCHRNHKPTIRLTSNSQCVACRDLKQKEIRTVDRIAPEFMVDLLTKGSPVFQGTRTQAEKATASYYVNPRRPCEKGHAPTIRRTSNTVCVACDAHLRDGKRDQYAAQRRGRWARDAEELTAKQRAKYAENPDYFKAHAKAWAEKNPDRKRVNMLRWGAENADRLRVYYAAWRVANPDKAAAKAHKRRAAKLGSTEHFTAAEVTVLYETQRGLCAYCGVALGERYERDHVTPLSRQGSNGIGNIALTCKPCNRKKRDMTLDEFVQRYGVA